MSHKPELKDPNHLNVKNVDLRSIKTRKAIKEQKTNWRKIMIYER